MPPLNAQKNPRIALKFAAAGAQGDPAAGGTFDRIGRAEDVTKPMHRNAVI
jgi:hypothetical protein